MVGTRVFAGMRFVKAPLALLAVMAAVLLATDALQGQQPPRPEPAPAGPADAEPADVTPADAEPTDTEPADTEPTDTEPTEPEPTKTVPAKTEPGKTAPAKNGPQPKEGDAKAEDTGWRDLSNLPDPVDIPIFVKLVADELGMKIIYDEQLDSAGRITIKTKKEVHVNELYGLLETALQAKGFAMLRIGDWVRILPTDQTAMVAPFVKPGDMPAVAVGDTTTNVMIQLKYADAKDVQDMLTPYLTERGSIIPLIDQRMVIITEYKSRLEILRQLIKLVDVRPQQIERRIRELTYTKAPDIAYKLSLFLQAVNQPRTRVVPVRTQLPTGGVRVNLTPVKVQPEGQPFIDVDERTNRLFMYGRSEDLDELEEMIALLDVPSKDFQEVRIYDLVYLAAKDAWAALEDLGLAGEEAARTATRLPTTPATTAAARARTPTRTPTTAVADVGGRGAAPRITVIEATNTLLIRATAEEHDRIEAFLAVADRKLDRQGNIRTYVLQRRKPEDLANILKEVVQADYIDPTTKTPIPGKEDAPVIVPMEATNSVIVNASASQHQDIQNLITQLDATQPQVLLEMTLVEVTTSDNMDVGIEFEDLRRAGGDDIYTSTDMGFAGRSLTTGFKTFASVPGLGATVAFMHDDMVNVVLRALETKSNGRVLSKPRVLVNDNELGLIISKDEEPVTSIDALNTATTTRTFKEYVAAGTQLEITPHISDGDFLKLEIKAEVSTFTDIAVALEVPPPRSTRNIETIITVPDRQTIIIGGLTGKRQIDTWQKVPILSDIPLLGLLFKRKTTLDTKTTIYLFVKATILRDTVNFEDLAEETQHARDSIPEELTKLDPTLTTEAAIEEVKKIIEMRRRRAEEKRKLEDEIKSLIPGVGQPDEEKMKVQTLPSKAPSKEEQPTDGGTAQPAADPSSATKAAPQTDGTTDIIVPMPE